MAMKLLERYSSAVNSDNLSVNPDTKWSDTDVLGAAGLAAKGHSLGIALTRLLADSKPGPVVAILTELAFRRARTLKVKMGQVEAEDLSKAVLAYHRYPTCQPCGGTGYQAIPGTPMLGAGCTHCRTSGRTPFEPLFPADRLELARWLSAEIERAQVAAGGAAMAMLAPRFEL
jgi:hypothetical protein